MQLRYLRLNTSLFVVRANALFLLLFCHTSHNLFLGHYNCGGVGAAIGHGQFGLIDNWLRYIKDVYRCKLE